MNNKAFKDENLGNVLQSGIKIYTNMDKDVQKTLQNDVDNGSFYKNKDQQVGATYPHRNWWFSCYIWWT